MRILVLGGDGMLGHKLPRELDCGHTTHTTLRRDTDTHEATRLFGDDNADFDSDLRDSDHLGTLVAKSQPDAIVNSASIARQRSSAADTISSIEIKALAPHQVASIAASHAVRLFHISTDCVFSRQSGGYGADEIPNPVGLHGRSKRLGEFAYQQHRLTIRTSKPARKTGLLEWFLAAQGPVHDYTRAVFSRLTTIELSPVIER